MTAFYMIDTNILIELLRDRGAAARPRLKANAGHIAVSTVSSMELEYGVGRSREPDRNRQAVNELLSLVDVVDFDEHAALVTGRIRAHLATAGTPIGPYDVQIAGHARALGMTVVTNNVKEFARVPGLQVEDWLTAPEP